MKSNYASLLNDSENYETYSIVPNVIDSSLSKTKPKVIEHMEKGKQCPKNHGYSKSKNECIECKKGEYVEEYIKDNAGKLKRVLPRCVEAGYDCAERMKKPLGVKKWIEECKDAKKGHYKFDKNVEIVHVIISELKKLEPTKSTTPHKLQRYEERFPNPPPAKENPEIMKEIEQQEDELVETFWPFSDSKDSCDTACKEQRDADSAGVDVHQIRLEKLFDQVFARLLHTDEALKNCDSEWTQTNDQNMIPDYTTAWIANPFGGGDQPWVWKDQTILIDTLGDDALGETSYVINQETMQCEPAGSSIYNCYGDDTKIYDQFSKECVSKKKGTNWEPPALPEGV